MRFAYSCHDAFPSSDTNTQQIFWTLFEVTRLGVQVDLFVPASTIPPGVDPRAAIPLHYGADPAALSDGFNIIPLDSRLPAGALDRGFFDWRIPMRVPKDGRPIWTRDPVTVLSCARVGRPVILETYRSDFAKETRFSWWRAACLESSDVRAVITHSHLTARAFVAAGVPSSRCLVAHNGYAPSLMSPALSREEARERLGLPRDRSLAVYAGHVGREKGMDALVRMAAAAPDIGVVILGVDPKSAGTRQLEQMVAGAGARNVLMRPEVPLPQVAAYLYAADCLVIPPTEAPLRRFHRTVVPMKIFSYLAAGRPILAPAIADVQEVLVDGENARLVPPDNPIEGARALRALLSDSDLQLRLSQGALASAAEFTWQARAQKIVRFLGQL